MISGGSWPLWSVTLCAVLLAASYLISNELRARLLAAAAFLVCTIAMVFSAKEPFWAGAVAALLLAALNVFLLVQRKSKATKVTLSPQELALREWMFPSLGNDEFQQLLNVSKKTYPVAGTFLVTQGEELEELHVIIQGTAHVVANGMVVATLRDGNLVGEVSFFRDDVATASVVAQTNLTVLSIERTQLRKLMRENDSLQRALHESIGRDLGFKLTAFDSTHI